MYASNVSIQGREMIDGHVELKLAVSACFLDGSITNDHQKNCPGSQIASRSMWRNKTIGMTVLKRRTRAMLAFA